MEQMRVEELKKRLEQGRQPVILDVREPWEFGICALPGSTHIPMGQIPQRLQELNKEDEIVVVCHHGSRSAFVAQFLQQQGFSKLYNLQGGVSAWAQYIDPQMRQY
jgi:rhodanese-related sulfurtransferase